MRAVELAAPFPTVRMQTPVLEAARLLASENLPGLIVVDDGGKPLTVIPGTQVLRLAVPGYIQEDPALARVVDEASADTFLEHLEGRTVENSLGSERSELPVVQGRATVMEIAALMARSRSPLVGVLDEDGVLQGVITLDALLDRMVGA